MTHELFLRDQNLIPCLPCRSDIQKSRRKWKPGPEQRPAISAGARTPAISASKRKILLAGLDVDVKRDHLDSVAKCIKLATGLDVEIVKLKTEYDEIPSNPKSLSDISTKLSGLDNKYAAICILTGKRYTSKAWIKQRNTEAAYFPHRRWKMWIPGLDEPGPKAKCPVIVLSVAAEIV